MNQKFNDLLKLIIILAFGFLFAFLSTVLHGQEISFHHSLLGTWELDQEEEYGVIVRWAFHGDVDWETRKMGYLLIYLNGKLSTTLDWKTLNGAIEVRSNRDRKWIYSTYYRTTKWELYLKDTSYIDGKLNFLRVCDTKHAKEYCNS